MSDDEQERALRRIREMAASIRGNKESMKAKLEIGLQNAKDEQERANIRSWLNHLDDLDEEPL